MNNNRVKYSVVVPVFESTDTLERLVNEIEHFVSPLGDLEIVMVDDCSSDDTWGSLKELKTSRSFLKIYRLGNNFGQAAATLCGIDYSSGDVIITIDDDLQYSPEEIPGMIRYFHANDYQMVLGIPKKKQRSGRYMLAEKLVRLFFRIRPMGHLNGRNISSSFRIFNALLRDSSAYGEGKIRSIHLANRLLSPRFIGHISVDHHPDHQDKKGGYSLRKRLSHFTDMLLVFNKNPLGLLSWPAMLLAICSLVAIALALIDTEVNLFTTIMPYLLSGLGSLILLCFVILGKYAGQIYNFQLGMPPYFIIESYE